MPRNSVTTYFMRPLIKLLKYQDKRLTGLSMRAMKWLGHSKHPIHPKHLFDDQRNQFLASLVRPGMVFLDIGSGSGSECLNALKSGASQVYGVEYNKSSIILSHERLADYKGQYDIFDLNLELASIPLPDHSVDLISFSNVLEHLNNRQTILTELRRILKADGQMYISIPNTNTPWKMFQRKFGVDSRDDDDHKIEYSVETLNEELASAGLKVTGELYPIVPSLPVNGLIALSAVISPRLYRYFQRWKHRFVEKRPEHSVGWYFLTENAS
ncbi:MAG: hypothetical protein AUJ12_07930 [Alphaproteobacteria bacterium CG1_02_46_17]|nr:MAG: hypothetical protein AUJ12_07930 [Alphaproteobacteria bacterium CG1_02_46_17]